MSPTTTTTRMPTMPTMTRTPRYPDYTDLGDHDTPGEDYWLLVDGWQIGQTYWCGGASILDGCRWASFGPAGLSMGHRTRDDAERVQVDAYLAERAAALGGEHHGCR
jgi:hypothetical protein